MSVDVADPGYELDEPETPPGALALNKEHGAIRVRRRRRRRIILSLYFETTLKYLNR